MESTSVSIAVAPNGATAEAGKQPPPGEGGTGQPRTGGQGPRAEVPAQVIQVEQLSRGTGKSWNY